MKVIEPGRPQEGWSKEVLCTGKGNGNGGCSARLLVEQPDLFLTYHSSREGQTTYVTFKCCECGVLTDIEDFPRHLVDTLPSKKQWDGQRKSDQ